MIGLRHAALTLCAIVLIALLVAGRHAALAGQPGPGAGTCDRAHFRVVIDVGHTINVPGAISARGIPEYAFNLQLARQATDALVGAGFAAATLLVTATAPWHGLVERAARANRMRADLFISIHHDSVPDYLLQTWQYAGQEQHYNDDYPGYAIFISNDNADRAGSLLFGGFLGTQLQARGLHYTAHYTLALMRHRRRELVDAKAGVYRYDQLIVLRETHMPAVLLEAGSIVNRQEELELASPERRQLIGAAVVSAVEDFCAARSRRSRHRLGKGAPQPHALVRPGHADSAPFPRHPLTRLERTFT